MDIESAVRVWMRRVLDEKGWSAEHWARVADTSATNISRFLSQGATLPTLRTMAKLAAAAGSWPELRGGAPALAPTMSFAPLVEVADVRLVFEGQRVKSGESIPVYGGASDHAAAFRVTADVYSHETCDHAIVVVEPIALLMPRRFDMVLVEGPRGFGLARYDVDVLLGHRAPVASLEDTEMFGTVVEILSMRRATDTPLIHHAAWGKT